MPDFDLAIIGAGASGLSIAAIAAQLGVSVALIERGRMGGASLNTGAVPTTALLAASRALRTVRDARRFGITANGGTANWDQIRTHVRGVITAIVPMHAEARFRALGATVLHGEARFTGPATLSVDGRTITARRFVIATGRRPVVPAIDGLAQTHYWTSETLFDLPRQPDHLLILGGSAYGLEMADAFSGLGSRVTVIDSGPIAAPEDPELATGLRLALTARGVTFRENAIVTAVLPAPAIALADGTTIEGSHLLIAMGTAPDLGALNLPAANIQPGPAGIATDRGLRSLGNRRVFAAGGVADPAGIGPRTHAGPHHAGIIIRRVLFRLPARIDANAVPRVIGTDPELAQTGLTEAEAAAAGLKPRILRWPLADNDRAIAERDTAGLVKLIISGNRIVGAGILAPQASEMIGQWTLAITQRAKLSALAGVVPPYPARSAAANRAAGSAFATLLSPRIKRLVRLLSRLG